MHIDNRTIAVVGGSVACVLSGATGLISWDLAPLFGLAATIFVLEELIRRMLMASLRFWFVVAVDTTCLVVTAVWLGLFKVLDGQLVMRDLLSSLVVAQLCGLLVGSILLFVAAIRQLLIFDREFPMPKKNSN